MIIPVVNEEAAKAEKKAKRAAKREKKFAPQETKQQEYVNLRTFQLKMAIKGGRIVYVNKEKSGPDHLLMLSKKPSKSRSLFILDKRTSSIRLASAPHLAMSNQATRGVKLGGNVVLRKYNESKTQVAKLGKYKRVLNKNGDCLTPHFYKNEEDNRLTWWNCNGSDAQKWKLLWQINQFKKSASAPHSRLHVMQRRTWGTKSYLNKLK